MEIGFSTFVLDGGRSGVATYVRELLRALQSEDRENRYDLLMAEGDAGLVPLANPNFRKTVLPPLLGRPLPNIAWHNTALFLAGRKYGVLHIPSARRIPLLKRTRVLATVHDLAAFSVPSKYGAARMFFNRRLVPAMIRRADRLIAVSHATKRDIVRYVGYPEDRITVIYSGIDHGLFRPVPKEEAREALRRLLGLRKPFFAYVSRLEHPAKNHVRLIGAFERFKRQHGSDHQLVLAGADWNGADAIRTRAAQSPARDDIVLAGFVPRETLPLLYGGCDLMVFPSLFEGFGFPVIEALACGAPVACSNTSSLKELAGDLLPTFDPLDIDAICRSLEEAVAGGWGAAERLRGTQYASGFEWRTTARHVMQAYRSLA